MATFSKLLFNFKFGTLVSLLLSCTPSQKSEQTSGLSGQVFTRAQQLLGPSQFDLNQAFACYPSFGSDPIVDTNRPLSLVVLPNQNGSYLAILPKNDDATFSLADFQSGSMEVRYFDNLRPVTRGHPLPTFEQSYWYTTLSNGNLNNFMLRILFNGVIENGLFLNGRLFTDFKGIQNTFVGKPVVCFLHTKILGPESDPGKLFVYHPVRETVGKNDRITLKKFSLSLDASIINKTKSGDEHFLLSMSDLNKGTVSLKTRAVFDSNSNIMGYVDSDNFKHFWKISVRSIFNANVKFDYFIKKITPHQLQPQCKDFGVFLSPLAQETICALAREKKLSDLASMVNIQNYDLVSALDFGRPICRRQ